MGLSDDSLESLRRLREESLRRRAEETNASSPRMTLAEPTPQKVWILWRNDRMLCVCGRYDRAWKELHDLMTAIGGVWHKSSDAHVWRQDEVTVLRIEAREVHW